MESHQELKAIAFRDRAASDMLEDALQNFDHIIDSANGVVCQLQDHYNDEESDITSTEFESGVRGVAGLMEDLRVAIEATLVVETNNDDDKKIFGGILLKHITSETVKFYQDLLQVEYVSNETQSEKISRLASENESLSLNVSVLTDQVELQTEKLTDLEAELVRIKDRLRGSDDRLREEVMAKTNLETQRLHLMNELSDVKISLVQMEQAQHLEEENQKNMKQHRKNLEEEIKKLKEELSRKSEEILPPPLVTVFAPAPFLASPDEGINLDDRKDVLDVRLSNLRMPNPSATSTPISDDKLKLKLCTGNNEDGEQLPSSQPLDHDPTARATSKPAKHDYTQQIITTTDDLHLKMKVDQEQPCARTLERLNGTKILPSTSVVSGGEGNVLSTAGDESSISGRSGDDVMWQSRTKKTKSNSTPNLAMTENTSEERPHVAVNDNAEEVACDQVDHFQQRKKHRFKKFFTSFKLRRSRSTSLDQNTVGGENVQVGKSKNFVRGGVVRATTGAKLVGWNNFSQTVTAKSAAAVGSFANWDKEAVCKWLVEIGLGMYVQPCRAWVTSGSMLLQATNHELEKDLGVRNPLHKKKLTLHLQSLSGEMDDVISVGAMSMDSMWVAKWLDDIGLPQYKDGLHEAAMDGLLLHNLTVGDSSKLGISNLFHLLSLRRAIEILRRCDFNPGKLQRRPLDEQAEERLELWTNHRVMEWLRTADLAEYAPNLRGSGVHGAVMVHEPLFTSDTLASLLHIPHNKTLLRRHLAAKLNDLLPAGSAAEKLRRAEAPGFQPLNIAVKYKIGRRSFASTFGVRSRHAVSSGGMREFSSSEFVCPIPSSISTLERHRTALEKKMQMVEIRDKRAMMECDEGDRQSGSSSGTVSIAELNESTTRELNMFSNQLNSLTSNWVEK